MKIVITGGPGTGKTTTLDYLFKLGYEVIPEAARLIINESRQEGGEQFPHLTQPETFQHKVLQRQLVLEEQAVENLTFIDRGIIDSYAYSRWRKISPPEQISLLARNRYDQIFILKPLGEIAKDSVRACDQKDVLTIQKHLKTAYREFDYRPIPVPVLLVNLRAEYILNQIKNLTVSVSADKWIGSVLRSRPSPSRDR